MVRCPHCGLGHAATRTHCPTTGLPVSASPAEASAARAALRRGDRTTRSGRSRVRRVEDLIGRIVGEYRILGLIGQGGMGTVYEVESLTRTFRAALKVLRPDQLGKAESISRFEREGRVLASIRHPNICHVYDVGRLGDDSPYLVMEKLEGETLAGRIERAGPGIGLPWENVVGIILQALEALEAAHSKNVIHRDFKPENIFISADATRGVKVLDFGISKQTGMEDAQANLTRTGMVMGTPYYMAPEQAMGDRNLDRRVDVWAAGVVMYEAMAGVRPFVAKNYNALLVQILTTHPKPIDELVRGLPKGLPGVLARALEKKRDARFLSVRELGDALRAVQRSNDRGLHMGRVVTGPPQVARPADPGYAGSQDRPPSAAQRPAAQVPHHVAASPAHHRAPVLRAPQHGASPVASTNMVIPPMRPPEAMLRAAASSPTGPRPTLPMASGPTAPPASPSEPRNRIGRGTQVMGSQGRPSAPVAARGRSLSDKAPNSIGRPQLAAPESMDEEESVALTLHHRRGKPPTLDLRPKELTGTGPESATVLRPHGHPVPREHLPIRELEDEPTTVLLRGDGEETPTVDDDDATQVDPPLFDAETTGSRRR